MQNSSRPFTRLALLLLVLAPTLCAAARTDGEESFTQRLQRNASRYERLGLSGVIGAQRGREPPVILGLGMADRLARTPHNGDTLFDLGAVSTQFTAAAVLRLRMAGALELRTPISALLPGVPVDKSEITVEQLLAHQSGLPEFVEMNAGDAAHMDRALGRILEAPLESEPGRATRFSAAGYTLLAMIVARTSGENFPDYVRREVFRASGMRNAHFLHDTDVDASVVAMRYDEPAGVDAIGSALTNRWSWETRGVTGVVASAADLLTFVNATRHGDFFDEEARAFFWRPDSGGRSPAGRHFESMDGGVRILCSGRSTGFEASVAVFPRQDVVLVLLANTNGVLSDVGPEIEKAVLFAESERDVAPTPELARLVGAYRLPDGSTIVIQASADTRDAVMIRATGQAALERVVHGDRYDPAWSVFYAEMNKRAADAVAALTRADVDAVRDFMERDATAEGAEHLISELRELVGEAPGGVAESLGTVSLDDAMISFIRFSDGPAFALQWRGRNLTGIDGRSPEDVVGVEARQVRMGLLEGPATDGISAFRLAYDQPGDSPIDTIKLLATKSAGPVIGQRVERE